MAPSTTLTSPLFRLLTPLLQTMRHGGARSLPSSQPISSFTFAAASSSSRGFSTTSAAMAKSKKANKGDTRVSAIRYHLWHPLMPRPLKFSRMRALRHWTIHRAWMLARRKRLEREELELQRMYQSMHSACEELRLMDPGTKDAGRLYRIAMEKKGVYGHDGIPIEYARFQTDTPGKEAWNHDWVR